MDEQDLLGAGPGGGDEPAGKQNGTGSRDRPAAFHGSGGDPLAPITGSSGGETKPPSSPLAETTPGSSSNSEHQEQTSTPSFAQEKEVETVDQEQNAQEQENKGKASEGQNKEEEEEEEEEEEGISSIPENPQEEKKDDFNEEEDRLKDPGIRLCGIAPTDCQEEDRLKDPGIRLCDITPTECHYEYPEYCKYPSFAYDPACDKKYDDHDYDPDFGKDWYKPYYWKAVVVHDCYCWGDYFKPWHYWNHWDYYWDSYYGDYHWDYDCYCWVYDYQPWYYWYYPSTIYHSFYGYHYYHVVYVKVFG